MSSIINKLFKSSIISSIALIAFGILLILQSEATIITISYVIGGLLIALGVIAGLSFFKNIKERSKNDLDIVYGIVCVILGVIVIQNPEAIASIIPFVLGLVIIINSATKLQYSFELYKEKNSLWLSTLVLSVISKTFKKIQNSIEENIKDAEVIEETTVEKKEEKKKKEDK